MKTRKLLAGAVLAALPTVLAAAPGVPGAGSATTLVQWGWLYGFDGGASLAWDIATVILCAFFGPAGGIACAVAGAF